MHRNRRGWRCAVKNREAGAAWNEANRERRRKTSAAWYKANREQKLKSNADWYRANREKRLEYVAAWYRDNLERRREYYAAYRLANRDHILERNRKYQEEKYRTDPLFRIRSHMRVARHKGTVAIQRATEKANEGVRIG